jgi:hypothetical protein
MNDNRFNPEFLDWLDAELTDAQIITDFNLGFDPRPAPLLAHAEPDALAE